MGLYEMPLSLSLLGFGDGDYVSQLPYVWYYVVLRALLNMLVRNASPRWPMWYRCLMFNLSGPCELLFLLCFTALCDLSCSECDVISLYFMCCPVSVSVCLVCCVFDSICETIRNMFGCGCYFVVECYGGVASVWRCSVG